MCRKIQHSHSTIQHVLVSCHNTVSFYCHLLLILAYLYSHYIFVVTTKWNDKNSAKVQFEENVGLRILVLKFLCS